MSTCQQRVSDAYRDQTNWTRMSILNTAQGRAVLVGSVDPGLLPRHLERAGPQRERRMIRRAGLTGRARAASLRRARASRCHRAARWRQLQCVFKARDAASSCCCSTIARPRSRHASFRSTERPPHLPLLARVRAGTSRRDRSMPIAHTDHLRRSAAFDSTPEAAPRSVRPCGRGPGCIRPHAQRAGQARTRRSR